MVYLVESPTKLQFSASSVYLSKDVAVDGSPLKPVKAMPRRGMGTAIVFFRIGGQVAAFFPHATPIQAVAALIQGLLERANQISKNKKQLLLLVDKAAEQSLLASKATNNGFAVRQEPDASINDFERLFEKILDYTHDVNCSSRWRNFFRVNKVAKVVSELDSDLTCSFRSLVYHVVGSILEEMARHNVSCRTPYDSTRSVERFDRGQIKTTRSRARRHAIGRKVDTVKMIAQLVDNTFVLVKQYQSKDPYAAIEAFTNELSKHRYINNVTEQLFSCSPEDPPILVYRITVPEQRISFWDVCDLDHYALILALLPEYLQDWKSNFGTVPLNDEEEYLDLEHWLRDLAITFAARDSNSVCKLTYCGELPDLNARKDTDATWESFLPWFSWSLLVWAPEFDVRIQKLVCGLQWGSPEPHHLDRMTREHPPTRILDQLQESARVDGRKPSLDIKGKIVTLDAKYYYRLCKETETFAHRYLDAEANCTRTEWIVWYKNEKRGFRINNCNCWVHETTHGPDIYEEFEEFLVTWST